MLRGKWIEAKMDNIELIHAFLFLTIFFRIAVNDAHCRSSSAQLDNAGEITFSNMSVPPSLRKLGLQSFHSQLTFSKSVYSFEVEEDTLPGTIVGHIEAMYGEENENTVYSVQEDDGDGLYLLNPHSGEFLLSRALDFEKECYYMLTTGAQQGDRELVSVRVYFNVIDVNDNPPVFSQNVFSAFIREDSPDGMCFLSLNVSDADEGIFGQVDLSVISGDLENVFSINSVGVLCHRENLDREKNPTYNLIIEASDHALPTETRHTASVQVNINLLDVNDNAPLITSASTVSVPENKPLYSVVTVAQATDPDAGLNAEVVFSIESEDEEPFSINSSTGVVYLQKTLDRERQNVITVTLRAQDQGVPPLYTLMNLTVLVEDVNDNSPEFSQSFYNLSIYEDIPCGTSLLRVNALDRDTGSNGQVRFSVSESGFMVDSVLGTVSVIEKLDREKKNIYSFPILANDQGNPQRSSTATINITVLDVNDCVPLFLTESLTLHVLENGEDSSQYTHQIHASDDDLGVNGLLNYLLEENDDSPFILHTNGIFHILEDLDREVRSHYMLKVSAVDSGFPSLTGTGTLVILIDDVNDNYPIFEKEEFNAYISEDFTVGSFFLRATASDSDDGTNGQIRYSLAGQDVPFLINKTSGDLFTADALDREAVASYSFLVFARDSHPTKPLSSSAVVSVIVEDVNDHFPSFLYGPYVANVPIGITKGSVVCTVVAEDTDVGLNAKQIFSLHGQYAHFFSINSHTGTVISKDAVNRRNDVTVDVHVQDEGKMPKWDTTTLTVRFQNDSHFPLIAVQIYKDLLFEDAPTGTLVANISAESLRGVPVSFYLASGNVGGVFSLHPSTGELTVKDPLDFEANKHFYLVLEARDSGIPPFSSYATIQLNISDVNDSPPVFSQNIYKCKVYENMASSSICSLLATDADRGGFAVVEYTILSGNTEDAFKLDKNHGILYSTKRLDREHIPYYNLSIKAVDKENTSLFAITTVVIEVLDTNDHAPRFPKIFMTDVPEDAAIGFSIIQITATDEDIGLNAIIEYIIISQNGKFPFNIDKTTGILHVAQILDREKKDHYVVKVNANDSAWSISTDVIIDITDVNDNAPIFSQALYTVTIPEMKIPDIFILQVSATDMDAGDNADILYFINGPNEFFYVNVSTGVVSTKLPIALTEKDTDIFTFTVVASDGGNVPLNSVCTVIVTLVKYNHFPPNFLPFKPLIPVLLNLDVGTEVIQVFAVDQDSPESESSIEYFNSGGNGSVYFEVELNRGRILVKKSLTDSLNKILLVQITAKDKGLPPLNVTTQLIFEVTPKNLFVPYFLEDYVEFFVPEDLPIASVIGKVQAKDKDGGINGIITYSTDVGNENGLFSVEHSSGLIMLVNELDFEQSEVHHLTIIATDGGWHPKKGLLNITVYVTDLNDNPPVFTPKDYVATISENAVVGTSVLQVWAKDSDTGSHSQITFVFTSGHTHLFDLDTNNGTITTLESFDYEINQYFVLTVKAINVSPPYLFDIAQIYIYITGVNEFIPAFQKHVFNFSVSEPLSTQTEIGRVIATDNDRGLDGEVFYLLMGQSKKSSYSVDKHTGVISIAKDLNAHIQNEEVLYVLAKNRGSITGFNVDEAVINIHVVDKNDPPEFYLLHYTIAVPEDISIGSSIIKVQAVDQDMILEWRMFSYSIEHGNINSSFTIDPNSGVISVNSNLDREIWAFYKLTVLAVDEGSPSATGSTKVAITVTDVNDNPPNLLTTEAFIQENQPGGTLVSHLTATDDDLSPNQGPYTYWMLRPIKSFSLTTDGVLVTSIPIDREQNPLFHLQIVIQDAGKPPMSSITVFQVKVLDENDNVPIPRHITIFVKYYGTTFPGGLIGNVKPTDMDELDVFKCTIKSGPIRMFGFPFGLCNLWSSSYQGEATFNISVEGFDQLHPSVNNSIYVKYKGFSNISLDNCVLFYIYLSSLEEFLSLKYLKFVKALDSLFNLQASKTHVFGMKVQGDKMLLLAAVKSYNGQYLAGDVASGVSSMHKKLLEAQSNVTISQIISDPCMLRPCHNGGTCNKNIHIIQEFAVLESSSLIFVSPYFVQIFNCSCPTGFIGDECDLDVDECTTEPCENGGKCYNNPGTYFCQCKEGFSGTRCTVADNKCQAVVCLNGGTCWNRQGGFICSCHPGYEGTFCGHVIDHCASSPCVYGNCSSLLTGYSCKCIFGVSGVNCEEQSYGFQELSYIEFPPLDPEYNLIYMEFATLQKNALIVYNHGDPAIPDFLALEVVNAKVCLSYDLGSGVMRLETEKSVSDGLFHSVTVRRNGNMALLEIDNCSASVPKGFCSSQNSKTGNQRFLEVSSNSMTLGGIKSIDAILRRQIRSHNFVGCMKNIQVNEIRPDSLTSLAFQNILNRCPRGDVPPCKSVECLNEGICQDQWSHYSCQCRDHFTGPDCSINPTEQHVLFLNGKTYVQFDVKESYKRNQLLQVTLDGKDNDSGDVHGLEIKIKTVTTNSVLVVCLSKTLRLELKISDGKPLYVFTNVTSGHEVDLSMEGNVSDGLWHVLQLRRRGSLISLFLDDQPVGNTMSGTIAQLIVIVETIILGPTALRENREVPEMSDYSAFRGCVEFIKFNGHLLHFSGYNEIVESSPLFQTVCISPKHCVLTPCLQDPCVSGLCLNNSECGSPIKEDYWCDCLLNTSESSCGSCSSELILTDSCSQTQKSAPIWIVAAIIPIVFLLLILVFCFILKRQKKISENEEKAQIYFTPHCKPAGVGDPGFSPPGTHQNDIGGPNQPPDLIKPQELENCGPLCHGTGIRGSELEYYEIDSMYPESKTFQMKNQIEQYTIEGVSQTIQSLKTKPILSPTLSLKTSGDGFHPWQHQSHLFLRKKLSPDLTAPPQHLTAIEVEKLNTPQDTTRLPNLIFRECHIMPVETSSARESHCSFTSSEFDCEREIPLISSRNKGEPSLSLHLTPRLL